MVAVSLVQVKKLCWGKLSQLSASKYCEFSDGNFEDETLLYVAFHCQNDLKTKKNTQK